MARKSSRRSGGANAKWKSHVASATKKPRGRATVRHTGHEAATVMGGTAGGFSNTPGTATLRRGNR